MSEITIKVDGKLVKVKIIDGVSVTYNGVVYKKGDVLCAYFVPFLG